MSAPASTGIPAVLEAVTALPVGRLRHALYPRALLRGTGFAVKPLLELGGCQGPADHARAMESSLAVVRAAFEDPRLREAVAQTNPVYYDISFAPGRALVTDTDCARLTKHGRRQVRTAHRYLRRFLGKTETNAFFGPTLVTAWDPDLDVPVEVGEPAPERCVTGLSHWVVRDLAARHRGSLSADRRAWARDPLWRRRGGELHCALNGRRITLTEQADTVWQLLHTPATPAELLRCVPMDAAPLRDALILLAPALRPWPAPPSTLIDGMGWLARQSIGGDVLPRIGKLLEETAAPWPGPRAVRAGVRAEITAAGLATSRAAGLHYADRDVVNEDRSSPWSGRVRLGRPAVAAAHRMLGETAPLMWLDAMLRQADAREAVVRHTGGTATGLVELAVGRVQPVTTRVARLRRLLSGLVPVDPALDEVRLDPGLLAERLRPLWEEVETVSGDQLVALPGFDLMAAGGPPGRGRWVLSECHDDSSSAIGGITSRVQPGSGRDFDDFRAAVSGWLDTERMATVVGRRRSRHVTPELPGLSIELSGVSGKPPGQVAPAAEVEVSADGTRVVYAGRARQLYPGDVPGPLFTALSLPCLVPVPFAAGRRRTPRIVLGDVVVQRLRWTVPLGGETGPFPRREAGFRAVTAWRIRHGLPDRVYLRHPHEPKPLLIDFTDPFAVDDLTRLPPARVTCTEVLPELTDTWWRAGGPQPAELRVPVFLRWERTTT